MRAAFHLNSRPKFFGAGDFIIATSTGSAASFSRCGRVSLIVDDWEISIATTRATAEAIEPLRKNGGHIVTHVGDVRCLDGKRFSTQELDRLLALLSYFFSFALGRWSTLGLAVGFDVDRKRAYEEWGVPRCPGGTWPSGRSWFHEMHSESICRPLPGFSRLRGDDAWKDTLTKAVSLNKFPDFSILQRQIAGFGVARRGN